MGFAKLYYCKPRRFPAHLLSPVWVKWRVLEVSLILFFLLLSTIISLVTHTHKCMYIYIIFFVGYPFCVRHNVMRKYFLSKKCGFCLEEEVAVGMTAEHGCCRVAQLQ